jgi:hypothetical protein
LPENSKKILSDSVQDIWVLKISVIYVNDFYLIIKKELNFDYNDDEEESIDTDSKVVNLILKN